MVVTNRPGGTASLPLAGGNGAGALAGRPQLMRALNERLLLEHIRTRGRALSNLKEDGLTKVAGLQTGFRGPPAALYEIRSDAGYVLGLDRGREYLRGARADLGGSIRARSFRQAATATAEERVAELVVLADLLASATGITRRRVAQVVVGSPASTIPGEEP